MEAEASGRAAAQTRQVLGTPVLHVLGNQNDVKGDVFAAALFTGHGATRADGPGLLKGDWPTDAAVLEPACINFVSAWFCKIAKQRFWVFW